MSQGQIGKDLPIAYASRTFNNAGRINSNADALSRNPPVLPFSPKCLTIHNETEITDASPPRRLQGVVVGACDSPPAISKEVEDIDIDSFTES